MVVGFNHNFRYMGEVYHIQTEDSGLKSPNIVTLLYQGGTILASKKTSYADITRIDNLEKVVEELMKEQHKDMLRKLKAGEFDAVIKRFKAGNAAAPQASKEEKVSAPSVEAGSVEAGSSPALPDAAYFTPSTTLNPEPEPEQEIIEVTEIVHKSEIVPEPEVEHKPPSPVATAEKPPSPVVESSLDEVILSYLLGDDEQ